MRIGDYEIAQELGRGGMGVVYVAQDLKLRRQVAIKLLIGNGATARSRFQEEALLVARLRHPNVVAIHDVGEHEGRPYYVMDLIEGESLEARLERGPLPIEEAARMGKQLAHALAHAHAEGVIHRDIKPGNVLLARDGRVLLTDFGLARDLSAERERLTLSGMIVGTPAYMPPEQTRPKRAGREDVDERSDVYSLGATLYHSLAAAPPFHAESLMALIAQISTEPPQALSTHGIDIPRDFEAIVLCCLEKAPEDRYPSARDLASDLARFQAGEPVSARRTLLASRLRRAFWGLNLGLKGALALIMTLGLLGASLAYGYTSWQSHRAESIAQVNLQLKWSQDQLKRSVYGLNPDYPLEAEPTEIARRRELLRGEAAILGDDSSLTQALAELDALDRLLALERGEKIPLWDGIATSSHIAVDACLRARWGDYEDALAALEQAGLNHPQERAGLVRVRLALLAEKDVWEFYRELTKTSPEDAFLRALVKRSLTGAYLELFLSLPSLESDELFRRRVADLERAQEQFQSDLETVRAAKASGLFALSEARVLKLLGGRDAAARVRLARLDRFVCRAPGVAGFYNWDPLGGVDGALFGGGLGTGQILESGRRLPERSPYLAFLYNHTRAAVSRRPEWNAVIFLSAFSPSRRGASESEPDRKLKAAIALHNEAWRQKGSDSWTGAWVPGVCLTSFAEDRGPALSTARVVFPTCVLLKVLQQLSLPNPSRERLFALLDLEEGGCGALPKALRLDLRTHLLRTTPSAEFDSLPQQLEPFRRIGRQLSERWRLTHAEFLAARHRGETLTGWTRLEEETIRAASEAEAPSRYQALAVRLQARPGVPRAQRLALVKRALTWSTPREGSKARDSLSLLAEELKH
ncbi:MAG: serine/threonine protein kinase [Planctomycetes bacterium]|nr:serine/threonine protein kinase [Planctomycetota bacterium]